MPGTGNRITVVVTLIPGSFIRLTDETDKEYITMVKKCKSRLELIDITKSYGWLTKDAVVQAEGMSDTEFHSIYKQGLYKENNGIYAGDDWHSLFGAILLPRKIFEISYLADQHNVPFGTAYHWLINDRRQGNRPMA